ncbi:recombinase RecT [Parvimonas micra]|uniref:recombinase RecT n=1 Tax=Parvimonas micra TaxID=33033 RepID=UPI00123BD6CE|nr:recombinase RecT [Parvimonas micra]
MKNEIKKIEEKQITDIVFNKVVDLQSKGAIDFPNNYSVGNALKSAYLILQEAKTREKKPVLQACTQESVANTLLDMVVQGLNPTKQQCYFIPYGNQLTLSRSYLGTIALTKRLKGVKDVVAYPIYKNDKLDIGFDILTGKTKINEFKPALDHKAQDLIGALGIIVGENEILYLEYMNMEQIRNAWNQGTMKGNSPAHKNFPDQMAIKTVINRVCKKYVNAADDSDKIADLISKTAEEVDNELEIEMAENANVKELPLDEIEEIELEEIDGQVAIEDVLEDAPF